MHLLTALGQLELLPQVLSQLLVQGGVVQEQVQLSGMDAGYHVDCYHPLLTCKGRQGYLLVIATYRSYTLIPMYY